MIVAIEEVIIVMILIKMTIVMILIEMIIVMILIEMIIVMILIEMIIIIILLAMSHEYYTTADGTSSPSARPDMLVVPPLLTCGSIDYGSCR